MASIYGGSGNELFFHGSTFLEGDGAILDLSQTDAKYYVCAISVYALPYCPNCSIPKLFPIILFFYFF